MASSGDTQQTSLPLYRVRVSFFAFVSFTSAGRMARLQAAASPESEFPVAGMPLLHTRAVTFTCHAARTIG